MTHVRLRRVLRASAAACTSLLFASMAIAAAGDPDPTFGLGGKVRESLSRGNDSADRVAVQADGRIVVVGEAARGGERDLLLARFLPDGAPDTSFGDRGSVLFGFKRNTERGASVAIQPDGRIVVAAQVEKGEDTARMLVARFLPDGRYDPSFGHKGRVTTAFDGTYLSPASVLVTRDGRIIVGGEGFVGGLSAIEGRAWILARYQPNGRLDRSFGTRGRVVKVMGNGIAALAEQPDGKIVAGGSAGPGWVDFAVARFFEDGSLDPAFGDGGVSVTSFSKDNDYVHGIAIDSQGRVVAAGRTWLNGRTSFAVARFLSDGTLDASFGDGGKVTTRIGVAGIAEGYDLVVADDRIAVAGWAYVDGLAQFVVVRYLDDGTIDAGFGSEGLAVTPVGRQAARASGAAMQGTDRLIVSGSSANPDGKLDAALVRYIW